MSELIEIHQLDYKACSLTYGEGACTASSSTRPAGEQVADFNGSNSQVGLSPVGLDSTNNQWFVEMEINQHSHININDGDGLYIEHANFSSGFGIFLKKYDAGTSYAFVSSSSGGSNSFNHTVNTLNRINLNTNTKIKIACTGTASSIHSLELYIDDVLSGSGTVFAVSQVPLYAFIGTAKNSSLNGLNFDGNIKNFKAGLTSVIRNLPLISDVTDTTGNSSPTAYNMTFPLTCPNTVDPNDPTQCALIENPDGKCFNTYATCQDIANYSQTSKTLTFAKKQAAALPLESLQRVEGTGAEFNGTSSNIELGAVYGLAGANNWELGLKFFYDGNDGVLYSEYSANGLHNSVTIFNNTLRLKFGNSPSGVNINSSLLNSFIELKINRVNSSANVGFYDISINGVTSQIGMLFASTTYSGSSIGADTVFNQSYYSGKIY
jgi:hypothetical protein